MNNSQSRARLMSLRNLLWLTCLAGPTLAPGNAAARIWQVPTQAPTIQAAIDSSIAGDIVEVECGTYFEHDIIMKSGVVLRGMTDEPDCVVIDAQKQGGALLCQDADQEVTFIGSRRLRPAAFVRNLLLPARYRGAIRHPEDGADQVGEESRENGITPDPGLPLAPARPGGVAPGTTFSRAWQLSAFSPTSRTSASPRPRTRW